MMSGRSRRPWCYHKRGMSLDDNLDNNSIDFLTEESSEELIEDEECVERRLAKLLSSEDMADVHFIIGRTTQLRIPAHKLILSIGSPVLKRLLTERDIIQLEDCDPKVFLELLRFLYCDKSLVNKDNAVALSVWAKTYEIPLLVKQCTQYIRHAINESNCLAIWLNAKQHSEREFQTLALKVVRINATRVLLAQDFLKADFESVREIIQDDGLRIPELQLFRAVTRWAKHQCLRSGQCPTRANIRVVLNDCLDFIRFPLMTDEEIRTRVQNEGVLDETVLRALLSHSRTWPRLTKQFNSNPRAFQILERHLLTVQTFKSFDNQLPNKSGMRSLAFSVNKPIFLAAIGVYGPKKACSFYLQVALSVTREDRLEDPTIVDRAEQSALLKCDGTQPIIHIKLETPFEIEPNCEYHIRANVSATSRPTSVMRSKLNPHLFYCRAQEVQYYYGLEPISVIKSKTFDDCVIFQMHALDDELVATSAPATPNPPPRPPPPKEYRRPSRMERLKRALSFSEKLKNESHVTGGQIPVLMFFA